MQKSIPKQMQKAANPALNPVRFALWTLRDKAAQRRLALLQGLSYMAESPTVLEEFTATLVSLGEAEVRAKLLQRVWNSPRKEWAIEWLEFEEKKISAAAALRAEAREEEILSVAKEANEIARAASFAATAAAAAASEANKIARSAKIISLIAATATAVAAIAAIVAIKW